MQDEKNCPPVIATFIHVMRNPRMEDGEASPTYIGIDMDAVVQDEVDAIEAYADLWLADRAPNQPIRMDPATAKPKVGHATFGAARDAWRALTGL